MDLPDTLGQQLHLPPEASVQVAAVVVGGLRERVALELGSAAARRLDRALPELAIWRAQGGMTAQVDGRRLALAVGRAEARAIAVVAEVLYGLGAEPAAADLVPPIVRSWLLVRLGAEAVDALTRIVPFLVGPEATPVPSGRGFRAAESA